MLTLAQSSDEQQLVDLMRQCSRTPSELLQAYHIVAFGRSRVLTINLRGNVTNFRTSAIIFMLRTFFISHSFSASSSSPLSAIVRLIFSACSYRSSSDLHTRKTACQYCKSSSRTRLSLRMLVECVPLQRAQHSERMRALLLKGTFSSVLLSS